MLRLTFAIFRWSAPLALAVALSSCSGCLADLRPADLGTRSSAANPERARELLQGAAEAISLNGRSPADWASMSGVRVRVTDEWFGLIAPMMAPWPVNPQPMRFAYVPFSDDSVIEFLNASGEPTGRAWGIHDWNTWRRAPGESGEYVDSETLSFALPTMQYFLEMPHRLAQPGDSAILDYAGAQEWNGKQYEVVYLTWGRYEPDDLMDQYVAWIDPETGMLARVDFTVRDQAPFVTASAFYEEHAEVDGFRVPTRVLIGDVGDADSQIHVYSVEEIELNVELPRSSYALDPDRAPRQKY